MCPYYAVRRALPEADVVLAPYRFAAAPLLYHPVSCARSVHWFIAPPCVDAPRPLDSRPEHLHPAYIHLCRSWQLVADTHVALLELPIDCMAAPCNC